MTKRELAEAVGDRLAFLESKHQAAQVVEAVLASIADGAQRDGKVSLNGFGAFKVRERPERNGVNPATGKKMRIPAARTIVFHPSQALRESLDSAKARSR